MYSAAVVRDDPSSSCPITGQFGKATCPAPPHVSTVRNLSRGALQHSVTERSCHCWMFSYEVMTLIMFSNKHLVAAHYQSSYYDHVLQSSSAQTLLSGLSPPRTRGERLGEVKNNGDISQGRKRCTHRHHLWTDNWNAFLFRNLLSAIVTLTTCEECDPLRVKSMFRMC